MLSLKKKSSASNFAKEQPVKKFELGDDFKFDFLDKRLDSINIDSPQKNDKSDFDMLEHAIKPKIVKEKYNMDSNPSKEGKNTFVLDNSFLNDLNFRRPNKQQNKRQISKERANFRMNFGTKQVRGREEEKPSNRRVSQVNTPYNLYKNSAASRTFEIKEDSIMNFGGRRGNQSRFE